MAGQEVNAAPTKEFFIYMITKDIKLERAIIDLIDNSIDGAKRLRGDGDFTGLRIDLTIKQDEFLIKDNCGGFDLDTAINYAFMFGRPEKGQRETPNSIGRFGVGMKRALFKIGNKFEVESHSGDDHFQVNVDALKWLEKPDEWTFNYELIDEIRDDLGSIQGTYIKVANLNNDVATEFKSEIFLGSLKEEIEKALNFSLERNLEITLNGVSLHKRGLSLLSYDLLKPYYKKIEFPNGSVVTAKIYAGVAEPSPDKAGWYIYCNNRLVLGSDKTNLTGWEGRRFGESSVVKYHNIYAMFRGIVFFDAEDAKKLPMTTTKTSIDPNTHIYQVTKHHMIDAMLQVMTFLKTIEDDPQRETIVQNSNRVDVIELKKIEFSDRFESPKMESPDSPGSTHSTISYRAEKELVNAVKRNLKVDSNRVVGEKTFQYFIDMEDITV